MKTKWKRKAIACLTSLALVGTMMPQNPFGMSWSKKVVAEIVLPTPNYLFDFENEITQNGASSVTNGSTGKVEIVEDTERGKVLHITDGGTESFGQNYYKLPTDIFKGVTEKTGATVSMRVKIPTGIAHEWSVLFNSTPANYNEWNLWKINANLVADVNAGVPHAYGGTGNDNVTSLEKDTWHNIVMTLSKENLKVYLNGTLKWSVAPSGGAESYATDGWTGPLNQLANNTFHVLGAGGFPGDGKTGDRDISDCYYDDIAIYPIALTEEQVSLLTSNQKVTSITVEPSNTTVSNEYLYVQNGSTETMVGSNCGSVQLNASVEPSSTAFNKNITWSIADSDKTKATVDENGLVKLTEEVKDNDTITVYATANDGSGVTGSCIITAFVTKKTEIAVSEINIESQSMLIGWERDKTNSTIVPKGEIITPQIQYTPDNADIKEVEFTTTNNDIIQIDGNKITALKEGTATVTATSKSSSGATTTFTVTVSEAQLGELISDFTSEGYVDRNPSGFDKITGDFDIVYTFHNQTNGNQIYQNFLFEVTNGENKWQTFRADPFGWGDYAGTVNWDPTIAPFTVDGMQDADVIVRAVRTGNSITVKYYIVDKDKKKYNIIGTANSEAGIPEILYVNLTGEMVTISNIKLTENTPFDLTCEGNATLSSSVKEVKIGDSVNFTVNPLTGYVIDKVVYDGEELTKDTDGNYTIPFIINNTEKVEITTTATQYSVSYVVDGKEDSVSEVTVEDANQEGKISLRAVSDGFNGWYLSEQDKTNKITEIDVNDLVNLEDSSIIVYGYNPYTISMNKDNPTSFEYGTIEALDTSKSYYLGDKVVIVTKPKKGFAANVKVITTENTEVEVTSEVGDAEDEQNVVFTMPASNVTITYSEFTGVDRSKIEAAIDAAKATYDKGNEDSAYTAVTWNEFKKTYDDAVTATANSEASQAELDTAQKALETAQEALTYVYKITLDKVSETIEVGESVTLTATVTTAGDNKNVTWSSSDTKVATVAENGEVTGVAAGEATITATAADGVTTATCKLTVNAPITYEVKLDKESAAIKVGDTIVLTATVTTNGTDKSVTWSSSNPEAATVADGKVTAIAAGEATITATAADNVATATCKVTITEKEPELEVPEGQSYLFDFEGEITKDGASPVTNGTTGKVEIVKDAERGNVLHITDGGTESFGQNYYKLPEDIFKGVTVESGATVAMWVKIPSEIKHEWSVLFSSNTGYNEWNLWKFNANRVCDVNAGTPNVWGSTVNTGTTGDGKTPVEKDNWHHITATLSKDLLNVYLDGVLIGTTPATGGDNSESQGWTDALNQLAKNTFHVLGAGGFPGQEKTGDRDISDCYYDDVAIYPTALTAEEVKNLCTSTPVKVTKVTVTPATAEAFNEYVYASEADKEAGNIQASRFGTVQLSASVEPSNAEMKDVAWSIDEADTTKAAIDEKGLVTLTDQAKDGDTVTVYATAKDGSGIRGSSVIKVSIKETVGPAKTEELEAAIAAAKSIYEAGNTENIYTDSSWDEFKKAYEAAVKAKDAITQGEIDEAKDALIKAQEGLIYKCMIALDKTEVTMKVAEVAIIAAVVTTAGIDKSIIWTSSDEKVATVTDGKVTAVSAGETSITATAADGTEAICKVTVVQDDSPIAPAGITLDKTELSLKVGDSQTLTAAVTPENAVNKEVTWSSDNESIAVVDGNGKVTAIAVGTTTIRATAVSDASITAGCAITVTQETQSGGNSSGGTTNSGGSSSSGSSTNTGNQGTNTPSDENNDNNNTTNPPSTTTKPDGTVVETSKETTADGTVKETVKETAVDGAVKETIKETASNGTVKETVKETTADNNITKEKVTETAATGKVTVAATVTDKKNEAVLNTVVEKDATGNVTKADAVISVGAADMSVSGKKASVMVNVSDVIMNAAAEQDGVDSVVIEITKPVVSSAYANKNVTNGVTVNVNIDTADNVAVSGIVLTSESIAEAKAAGQKLTINVITKDADKADYKVVIPANQLKKITDTTKPVDIMVETIAAAKLTNDSSKGKVSADVKDVLAKSKAKQEKTYVLSVADNENMKAGMKVTAKVNKDTTISAKQTVYVYKYNEKTGKFVEVANSKQTVSADGTVTIDANSGTDYVVSSKKLTGSKVTTIKSKVKATIEKSSVKAGKSISIDVTLPSELKKVKNFGGSSTFGKEQAIILYESSNTKVASVTAKGMVKTKRAGKAVITVTVGMEGGQTKKIKKTITVK